jgi:hypothetical protein
MYESYKSAFHTALDNHSVETLLPYKKQINRAFEVPLPGWPLENPPLVAGSKSPTL